MPPSSFGPINWARSQNRNAEIDRVGIEHSDQSSQSKWKIIRGWHTLRHSFISNLASRGVSERIIMELAGHLNPETTRRYARLFPSTMTDTINLVFGNGQRVVVTDAR